MKSLVAAKKGLEKISFIKSWVNDEFIRRRDKLAFIPPPLVALNDCYNTWRDFHLNSFKYDETETPTNVEELKQEVPKSITIKNLPGKGSVIFT